MILSGSLGPGDRLPAEQELAEALGVSRNSLREAVRALVVLQVLDVRQGDGTYVTSLAPARLLDALGFVVDLQQDDSVQHFLAVRRILEPAAAALAARLVTETDAAELRELNAKISPDSPLDELVADDVAFHGRIGQLSGNPVLSSLIDSLAAPTVRARIWRGVTESGATERTVREHSLIVDALAAGDAGLASALTVAHIAGVEAWLTRLR